MPVTWCWCRTSATRPTGEVFNLAWEDVAENVAVALKADKLLMYTDQLPTDRKGAILSELTAREAEALLKKPDLTSQQTARAIEHAVRAAGGGVGRAHLITRRVESSLLLELFTHTGVGTMINAEPVEKLRAARIEDVQRHPRADRAAGGRRHPGQAQPRAARGRDRQLPGGRARRRDRRLRRALPVSRGQERGVRLPRRGAGLPRRRLRRAAAQGLRGARARALKLRRLFALTTHAAHWFLEQGFRAGEPSALPSQRQAMYNWRRNSKVFLKRTIIRAWQEQ